MADISQLGQRYNAIRDYRKLSHDKSRKITEFSRMPMNSEGYDGDMGVYLGPNGMTFLVKAFSRWHTFLSQLDDRNPSVERGIVWKEPILENSWVARGISYDDPGYCKDSDGFIHLRGLLKDGSSAGADMFSLPVGYKPKRRHSFVSIASSGACQINVDNDGDVLAFSGGSTTWTSINGITFYVGN